VRGIPASEWLKIYADALRLEEDHVKRSHHILPYYGHSSILSTGKKLDATVVYDLVGRLSFIE